MGLVGARAARVGGDTGRHAGSKASQWPVGSEQESHALPPDRRSSPRTGARTLRSEALGRHHPHGVIPTRATVLEAFGARIARAIDSDLARGGIVPPA
jgi:hypothetical protein